MILDLLGMVYINNNFPSISVQERQWGLNREVAIYMVFGITVGA